jgi:hypothetical protein
MKDRRTDDIDSVVATRLACKFQRGGDLTGLGTLCGQESGF